MGQQISTPSDIKQDEAGYPTGMVPTHVQSLPQQQGYPAQVAYTNPRDQQGYILQPAAYSHVSNNYPRLFIIIILYIMVIVDTQSCNNNLDYYVNCIILII